MVQVHENISRYQPEQAATLMGKKKWGHFHSGPDAVCSGRR